jgi:hypothetical protein
VWRWCVCSYLCLRGQFAESNVPGRRRHQRLARARRSHGRHRALVGHIGRDRSGRHRPDAIGSARRRGGAEPRPRDLPHDPAEPDLGVRVQPTRDPARNGALPATGRAPAPDDGGRYDVSVVTSSLLLRRWVRPADSMLSGERRVLPEPLWIEACGAMGDVWDALRARERLFGGARSGYAQVNTEESVGACLLGIATDVFCRQRHPWSANHSQDLGRPLLLYIVVDI